MGMFWKALFSEFKKAFSDDVDSAPQPVRRADDPEAVKKIWDGSRKQMLKKEFVLFDKIDEYNAIVKKLNEIRRNYCLKNVKLLVKEGYNVEEALLEIVEVIESGEISPQNYLDKLDYTAEIREYSSPIATFADAEGYKKICDKCSNKLTKMFNDINVYIDLLKKEESDWNLLEKNDFAASNAMKANLCVLSSVLYSTQAFDKFGNMTQSYLSSMGSLTNEFDLIMCFMYGMLKLTTPNKELTTKIYEFNQRITKIEYQKSHFTKMIYPKVYPDIQRLVNIANMEFMKFWPTEDYCRGLLRLANQYDTLKGAKAHALRCDEALKKINKASSQIDLLAKVISEEELVLADLRQKRHQNPKNFEGEMGKKFVALLEELLSERVYYKNGEVNKYYKRAVMELKKLDSMI